jgi:hypothetical protein
LTWHATIIVLYVVLVAGGVGLPFPEDLTLLGPARSRSRVCCG